jgi:hypothetical protein
MSKRHKSFQSSSSCGAARSSSEMHWAIALRSLAFSPTIVPQGSLDDGSECGLDLRQPRKPRAFHTIDDIEAHTRHVSRITKDLQNFRRQEFRGQPESLVSNDPPKNG